MTLQEAREILKNASEATTAEEKKLVAQALALVSGGYLGPLGG